MKAQWRLKVTNCKIDELVKKANVSKTVAKVLANRGIKNIEEVKQFINPKLEYLHDPFLMKDMDKATDMILDAIEDEKKIVIYGDYDADGVTSTFILYKALKDLEANVEYYIPDRETEGYGMSSERIKILKDEGADVILTCDNGISAIKEIEFAKSIGLRVVITDHHELPFNECNGEKQYIIPNADAIVNPKQSDCKYPFKLLCGAGIAFKFVQALYSKIGIEEEKAYKFIEFAGIGTICDVVDLIGENRIIAKNSLKMMEKTNNIGLAALIDVLGIKDKTIKSYHVGFMIGPCINATGRLDTATLSVKLLLSKDANEALKLANLLNELNKKRQDMTIKNVEDITEFIKKSDLKKDKVLVVYKKDVHESIAGIVAGKIREKFNVPTIVITKGKEMPKGSGRSIEEYNLFEELIKCKNLMCKFGGHPMAAGLSIEEENILKLRKKLNENCTLTNKDIIPKIKIDRRIPISQVNPKFIEEIENLEPFGKGNPTPLFAEKNIEICDIKILGKAKNTLKLSCTMENKSKIEGICFNMVEDFKDMLKKQYGNNYEKILINPKGLKLDLIFSPGFNEFNGVKKEQLRIKDFRISQIN